MIQDAHREVFGNVSLPLEILHYVLSVAAVIILVSSVLLGIAAWIGHRKKV